MANKNQKSIKCGRDEQVSLYFKELIKFLIDSEEKGVVLPKQKVSALKSKIARKYSLGKTPRDMDILMMADLEDLEKLKYLKTKPTRSLSGVAVIAVMTKPEKCPHGKCIFCPGGLNSEYGDTPQSYTGFEPATRRGRRNDYDSFLQVFNRLEQYVLGGHNPNKVDLIVMGGTFPSYNLEYQIDFIIGVYLAMNVFSDLFYMKKSNIYIDSSGNKKEKINYDLDLVKFKTFFELPHDVNDKDMENNLKKKSYNLKEKYLSELNECYQDKTKILEKLKLYNETCAIRCIGMTQETRPDCPFLETANRMLQHGVTRVELGVQSIYNDVLKFSNRQHTIEDSVEATQIMKDLGFKINYHMMLGLPGVTKERDLESLRKIFSDEHFKPDMIKIYPCMIFPKTTLFKLYKEGKFRAIQIESAVEVIGTFLAEIPEYVRVMRIQRDIPSNLVSDGVKKTNLRQYVDKYMSDNGLVCRDIRSREVIRNSSKVNIDNIEIRIFEYEASGGKEFFISAEDFQHNVLIGFCRLRFIGKVLRSEFTSSSAIIRELHVYGAALNVGMSSETYEKSGQHKGWGKKLVSVAEEICVKHGKDKLLVISGVGVREYYRNLGFINDGVYVSKKL